MLIPAVQGGHQLLVTKITISSNTTNYSLAADLQNNYGWDGSSPIEVELTINSGVYVYDTSASGVGLLASLVSGSILTINNSGNIHGKGGAGGAGGSASTIQRNGSAGTAGTDAIKLENVTATINNLSGGVIAGGGGGGGGQGNARGSPTNDPENGCTGDKQNGGSSGGSGAPNNSPSVPTNSPSGNGGSWGQVGGGGSSGSLSGINGSCINFRGGGGAGGAAGKAINVGSGASRTYNDSGTTYGATS